VLTLTTPLGLLQLFVSGLPAQPAGYAAAAFRPSPFTVCKRCVRIAAIRRCCPCCYCQLRCWRSCHLHESESTRGSACKARGIACYACRKHCTASGPCCFWNHRFWQYAQHVRASCLSSSTRCDRIWSTSNCDRSHRSRAFWTWRELCRWRNCTSAPSTHSPPAPAPSASPTQLRPSPRSACTAAVPQRRRPASAARGVDCDCCVQPHHEPNTVAAARW
jgi:hypothetical protein